MYLKCLEPAVGWDLHECMCLWWSGGTEFATGYTIYLIITGIGTVCDCLFVCMYCISVCVCMLCTLSHVGGYVEPESMVLLKEEVGVLFCFLVVFFNAKLHLVLPFLENHPLSFSFSFSFPSPSSSLSASGDADTL